jgi:hypothetical protein
MSPLASLYLRFGKSIRENSFSSISFIKSNLAIDEPLSDPQKP